MRILQLINTLQAGGAETMGVHFANLLSEKIVLSALVSTRLEGSLKTKISAEVPFICLHKKSALDIFALRKLYSFVSKNKIQIIHAHGTTFFTAFLLKCIRPKTKIIYHEHFGNRVNESLKQNVFLVFCSYFFTEIVVVNFELKNWFEKFIYRKKVTFLPNFALFYGNEIAQTLLKGILGKRIIMLANLKYPKNHFFVVKAFHEMKLAEDGWSLHLVGKIFNDNYFYEIENFLENNQLSNSIYFYDSCSDIKNILSQANIGILASTSEGFPVTILEYALMSLAVVSANIGFCSTIINNGITGFLFNVNDSNSFKINLQKCIDNEDLRDRVAKNLNQYCNENYSENIVIKKLINLYALNLT